MKKFKNLINEIQQPLSQGEKNFKDMHGDLTVAIEKAKKLVPGITDQDVIFNGIEKTNSIKAEIDKNISDYDKGLKVGPNPEKTMSEKTLTPAELKKREEIAQAMERDDPDMPMAKKMAIATATAKRVAEADTFAKDNKEFISKNYRNKNQQTANMRTKEVDTIINHDCAKHIAHEEWGFGTCIHGEHNIVETSEGEGYVTHYDIMFEHGIEYDVPVEDIKVIMSESHGHTPRKTMQEEAEMDYEGEMARSELNAICDKSRKLADMMADDMQLEAWLQSKITKAKYMIDSVYDYLMYSDKQSPMPSADISSYAQAPAMAANYSSFLNKMAEEKILSAKQKVIAKLNPPEDELDAGDFKTLRGTKKDTDTEDTTAHRRKIISKTVQEAAADDEEKTDKQSGASLNPITRLRAAHQLLRGKIGSKHPIKFDDGKHELDINTVRKALDLHGNAKTAAEKEKIQNAFKTHAGLQDALKGKFAAPRNKVSLGGSKLIGGIGEYGSVMQEDSDLDERVNPTTRPAAVGALRAAVFRDKFGVLRMSKPTKGIPSNRDVIDAMSEEEQHIATEEIMLNSLYQSLSEDNKEKFMEKLETEDGLADLLEFAQEQGF